MRNGQNNNNNNKRMRNNRSGGGSNNGGSNNGNNNNNNNNRRGQNPMTRVFESNGPDIKIRGTASHVAEKYVQLARDARSSGDPVAAENYYQHAEHYFRLIAAAQEQFRQNQPQPRTENEMQAEDSDDESESYSNFGAEPGFVPTQPQLQPQPQPQPFLQREPRDQQPRDPQYQPREQPPREARDQQPREQREHQPREQREHQPREPREHRPQPQAQFQPQPQPGLPLGESVDRLPSFITGPQPAVAATGSFDPNGAERFTPRRRRRPHGPRPDAAGAPAPVTPGDDFNPGNS